MIERLGAVLLRKKTREKEKESVGTLVQTLRAEGEKRKRTQSQS